MGTTAPHRTDQTEAQIVERAQHGDEAAFRELYRRHGHPAWRVALAVGASAAVAEHAVTKGFTGALRRLRKGTTSLVVPFRLQAVRASLEVAATAARHDDAPVDPPVNEHVAAFGELPERWRAAIWLTAVEGGTPAQVAPILGLTEEATANLTARATAGFRERYLRDGPERVFDDIRDAAVPLRALVVAVPPTLEARVVEQWAAWQEELAKDEGHRLAAMLPFGPWAERAVAGAAAAVFAGGVACAIALSSRPARNAPELAAPVSSGQLASGAGTANIGGAFGSEITGNPLVAGSSAHVLATNTARSIAGTVSGVAQPATPATSDPGTGTTPTSPPPSGSSPTTPSAPADPADPPATNPQAGVSASTDVAGTPIAVQVGGNGTGITVGDTTIGTPPPPPSGGTTVTIDTGLLPPITLTLP